jgi:Helix-turn-helix domain/Bacterial regulatory proteins, gntR family
VRKYVQAAAIVRAQIADRALKPGQPAPSGDSLARLTGFSALTCRKALRTLVAEGVLSPGASPNARPRVAAPGGTRPGGAARELSRTLAALRRVNGLTQPALSVLTGYSVTTIGHAETGRLWQSRAFWETADGALGAGGELIRLHDSYHARASGPVGVLEQPAAQASDAPAPAALARMTLHWSDGTATTVYPSGFPVLEPGSRAAAGRQTGSDRSVVLPIGQPFA